MLVFLSGLSYSCNDWLEVGSKEEVFEEDAFASAKGFRSALVGIYRTVASANLWGQELTWGFLSTISWNYQSNYAIPKYRVPIQQDVYGDNNTRGVIENIWKTAYNAIANCNNLLKQIENSTADFEYSWEKEMIMAEARGLRALLHFEMLRLFTPAPVTGYTGTAIPYVKKYPDMHPNYGTMEEVFSDIIEDLEYARQTLKAIDIDLFNKSEYIFSGIVFSTIEGVLFQGIRNLQDDGTHGEGNTSTRGFFSYRGFRMNYWGATALLARVYSYKRDNGLAEKYADEILDEWISDIKFHLYSTNPSAATNPNMVNGKRLPEPLIAFWDNQLCTRYAAEIGTAYNRIVDLKALFGNDQSEDYRYTNLYNASNYRYRVWDGPNSAYSTNRDILSYSNPCVPVLELAEIYFIKAECLAASGKIDEAIRTLKNVRDARGCTIAVSASGYDGFMEILVNESTRDFITRGQTWHFLKKLNWQTIYNGAAVYKEVPAGWFVLPLPDSETTYY